MSDFDKEAEREKLREKYEQDEEERAATEQMSELLLKGATMTNAHCSDCGDPIFRYDGQEFCPTCEKPVDRSGDPAEEGDADDNAAAGRDTVEVRKPSDDARVRFGGDQADAEAPPEETPDEPAPEHQRANQSGRDRLTTNQPMGDETTADQPSAEHQPSTEPTRRAPSLDPDSTTRVADDLPTEQQARGGQTPQRGPTDAGEERAAASSDVGRTIASARASLARSAARFAQAAEGTEDPTMATEYLEAAREAAAALDELD